MANFIVTVIKTSKLTQHFARHYFMSVKHKKARKYEKNTRRRYAFSFSFLRWGETESTWYVGH
jgi:hypothetical protein